MLKIKGIINTVLRYPITLGILLLLPVVYQGITNRTVAGCIGTTLFGVILIMPLEWFLKNKLKLDLFGRRGSAFISMVILYDIGALLMPEKFFSQLGFSILIIIGAIIPAILIIAGNGSIFEKAADILMVIGLGIGLIYLMQYMGAFSADSYSYYEISETFFNNFGQVGTTRQYVIESDYNISFPYFYPLLIFITNIITGLGRYSGVFINLFIMLYTGVLFIYISKHFTKFRWPGDLAAFFMFTNIQYLGELSAARSIPVNILFATLCIFICLELYLNPKAKNNFAFFAGLSAGITMVIRFDGLALTAFCALVILLIRPGKRIKSFLFYISGAFLAALPWIIYSLINIGTVWASDNSGTMFLVSPTFPNRIIIPGDSTLTLFNAPQLWLDALKNKIGYVFSSLLNCSQGAGIIFICAVIAIIVRLLLNKDLIKQNKKMIIATVTMILFYTAKTFMYALVGYADARYHVETVVVLLLGILVFTAKLYGQVLKEKIKVWLSVLLVCLLASVSVFNCRDTVKYFFYNNTRQPLASIEVMPYWVDNLNKNMIINIPDKNSKILFLGDGFTFGGWTDWRIYVSPVNLNWERLQYAMKNYMDVDYIAVPKENTLPADIESNLSMLYRVVQIGDYNFYKVY